MKKLLVLTAAVTAMLNSSVFAAAKFNDVYKDFKTTVVSGELLIEARGLFEEMGYACSWDADTKTTVFSKDAESVAIASAAGEITVNGQPLQTDVKPVISDGVTYVPADLIEKLDVDIKWDYKNEYPLLYSQGYTPKENIESGKWNYTKTEYSVNNVPLTGRQYIDGKMYNFGNDGILRKGIFADGSGIWGYDEYGSPYNGFFTYDGSKYYFDNGFAYTKPTAINEKMYNFASDGTLTVGWSEADGKKMYFNEFGYPEEGIVEIDGERYYFIQGVMQTGAVVYNDKNYFFNEDGTMVTDTLIKDVYYSADGVGIKYSQAYLNLQSKAKNILAQIGTSPYAIYNYVAGHVGYKYMAQQDWTTMANTGFNTGRGACYNFAACVDILLKNAGYETRVVRGTGYFTSLHYWNQVKINGNWTNIDACNKLYNVSDAYLKSKSYTFNKYEYPEYH